MKNIESVIVEGWKFIQETYIYFSQADYCGKSVLFQTLITFVCTYSMLQNIHTYTEKRVEYSYTISVLLESSGAELQSLENACNSCCTLHILPLLYMNPTGLI